MEGARGGQMKSDRGIRDESREEEGRFLKGVVEV